MEFSEDYSHPNISKKYMTTIICNKGQVGQSWIHASQLYLLILLTELLSRTDPSRVRPTTSGVHTKGLI